jgi:DNA repair protein REV1
VASVDSSKTVPDPSTSDEEISPDFLAALPPEIRREVLENQKRSRLKKKGGLDVGIRAKRRAQPETELPAGQRRLRLPPNPEKPTFTAKKLSSLPDLRDAMSAWYEEFKDDGPYGEDVEALVKYLNRVVLEERDLDKAVSVVKWIGWLVAQDPDLGNRTTSNGSQEKGWTKALKDIQDGVQNAIKERGLAIVDF